MQMLCHRRASQIERRQELTWKNVAEVPRATLWMRYGKAYKREML